MGRVGFELPRRKEKEDEGGRWRERARVNNIAVAALVGRLKALRCCCRLGFAFDGEERGGDSLSVAVSISQVSVDRHISAPRGDGACYARAQA
jgi:hypothetical protein